MGSIRAKLLRASLIVAGILLFALVIFFTTNAFVIQKYKSISDNLSAEYRLTEAVSDLIKAYNTRVRNLNTDATQSDEEIARLTEELQTLTAFLDTRIANTASVASYTGLKNTITAIVELIEQGLDEISRGDLERSYAHFYEANQKYGFIKENANVLFNDELKYISSIQKQIDLIYWINIIGNIFVLLCVGIGGIFYLFSFSNSIVIPLQKLTVIAETIANGKGDTHIGSELLAQNDEIGSLAKSYNIMITRLLESIKRLDSSNKSIQESSIKLTGKNDELERLNKFMVGRELKMLELKERVRVLEEAAKKGSG